jgi:hypothetical protein
LPPRPRALDPLHLRKPPEAPEAQVALVEALVLRQRFHLAKVPLHRFFHRRRCRHRVPMGVFDRLRDLRFCLRPLAGGTPANRAGKGETTVSSSKRGRDDVQPGNTLKLTGVGGQHGQVVE